MLRIVSGDLAFVKYTKMIHWSTISVKFELRPFPCKKGILNFRPDFVLGNFIRLAMLDIFMETIDPNSISVLKHSRNPKSYPHDIILNQIAKPNLPSKKATL